MHSTAGEREMQVINLIKATVVASPDVEMLLQVNTFRSSRVFKADGLAKTRLYDLHDY